jgi:PIN domain nuclease of toxin-antitoxin system
VTYLLDTSVWYRAAVAPKTLAEELREILSRHEELFGLSEISVWELAKKHQIGKLTLEVGLADWLQETLTSQIELLALSPEIIVDAMKLPGFPNRDPADELIVATARVHNITLLTTDNAIRGYRYAKIRYWKLSVPQ